MLNCRRRTLIVTLAMILGEALFVPLVLAQMRPGQPPVLEPPPQQSPPPMPDFAGEFRTRYAASGSPRIMLFWNTELTARAKSDVALQDRTTISGSRTVNVTRQSTIGNFGNSTLIEGNAQGKAQRQRDITVGEKDDTVRATTLTSRDAAQFQRAFDAAMRNGGALLVDRAMAVRSTSTEKERAAENSKLLEADAILGKADLLLQVLFVADDRAPIGYAFDISVRDVKTGAVLASFYTAATPPPPPIRTGYEATNRGFERRTTVMDVTGIEHVAATLANEVMNQLGPVLPAFAAAARK